MDDFEESMYDEEESTSDERREVIDKSRDLYDKTKELKANSNNSANQQVANQTAKEAAKQGAKDATKQGSKELAKETSKEVAKEGSKKAAETGAKAGAKAAASGGAKAATKFIPYVGWVLLALDVLAAAGKLAKKEIQKRKTEGKDKKVKRTIRNLAPLLLLIGIILIPVALIIFTFSIGYTTTTYDSVERVDEYVTCLESNSKCDDITGLELDNEITGYGKPLVLFTKKELEDAAKKYSEFSSEYFETGEGFFNDDYSDVKEDFGIGQDYNLEKKELDSAVLANFFSLEARAFSNIKWVEVTWDDDKNCPVEKPIEDFDIFYDSSKDKSTISSWFSWLSPNREEYVIKIPSVEKYSVTNTKVDVIVNNKTVTRDGASKTENLDMVDTDTDSPPKDKIDDAYKISILNSYINRIKIYLPQWYEPYAVYLATGDVKYAKQFYEKYLDLLAVPPSSGGFQITVKLYKNVYNYKETVTSQITTNYNYNESSRSYTETVYTEKQSNITRTWYASIVDSGSADTSMLIKSGYNYTMAHNIQEEPVKVTNPNSTFPLMEKQGEDEDAPIVQVGTGQQTENWQNTETFYYDQLPPKDAPPLSDSITFYSDLINIDKYEDNKYVEMRLAYAYWLICKADKIEFNIDKIAAALEVVKEYYNNTRNGSSSNTIPGLSGSGSGNTYDGAVKPGQTDTTNGGWDKTYTSTSGITYREYKQDLGYYANYQYHIWGPFSSYACPIVATSIFLEGYGIYVDPWALYQKVGAQNPAMAVNNYLGRSVAVSQTYSKEVTIDLLKSGKPVAIHNSSWNSDGHYMTLLDYDPVTDRVYLSTVHTGFAGRTEGGWIDIDDIGIDTIYYISDGRL